MLNTASSHGRGVLMRTVNTHAKTHSSSVWTTSRVASFFFFLKGLAWVKLQGEGCLGDQHGMGGAWAPPPSPALRGSANVTRFLFTPLLSKIPFIARPDEAWPSSGSNSDSCYSISFLQVVLTPLSPVPFKSPSVVVFRVFSSLPIVQCSCGPEGTVTVCEQLIWFLH